jgi:hypothetical protein
LWLGAALFGAALAGPAGAFVNGPCRATFAGVDAEGLETGSSSYAIDVPENGTVNYTMTAPDGLASWKFVLVYGPYEEVIDEGRAEPPRPGDLGLGLRFRGLVGDATVDESGNTVSGSAVVEDYAWMGAGLYEVQGFVVTKSGATCEGAVLIDVAGNPLTTVLGGAAAAATLVGAIGIAGVTLGGLRDGGELISALDDYGERAEPPPSDDADGAPAAGESGAPPQRSSARLVAPSSRPKPWPPTRQVRSLTSRKVMRTTPRSTSRSRPVSSRASKSTWTRTAWVSSRRRRWPVPRR